MHTQELTEAEGDWGKVSKLHCRVIIGMEIRRNRAPPCCHPPPLCITRAIRMACVTCMPAPQPRAKTHPAGGTLEVVREKTALGAGSTFRFAVPLPLTSRPETPVLGAVEGLGEGGAPAVRSPPAAFRRPGHDVHAAASRNDLSAVLHCPPPLQLKLLERTTTATRILSLWGVLVACPAGGSAAG